MIFCGNYSFSQDCSLSFEQLVEVIDYSLSDFDTFALTNGYLYDSEQIYKCGSGSGQQAIALGKHHTTGYPLVFYWTEETEEYLNFKKIFEKGELLETTNEYDNLNFVYRYDVFQIELGSVSLFPEYNNYTILIRKTTL